MESTIEDIVDSYSIVCDCLPIPLFKESVSKVVYDLLILGGASTGFGNGSNALPIGIGPLETGGDGGGMIGIGPLETGGGGGGMIGIGPVCLGGADGLGLIGIGPVCTGGLGICGGDGLRIGPPLVIDTNS